MSIRLTERQRSIITRLRKSPGFKDMISPDVARQLINKGIVEKIDTYTRVEWNRKVKGSTLWVCRLKRDWWHSY